ncbi:hypothetical protein LEMLEM_LOCUS15387 [Lemmus lemmus]
MDCDLQVENYGPRPYCHISNHLKIVLSNHDTQWV